MKNIKILGFAVLMLTLVSATLLQIELELKSFLDDKIELNIPNGFEIMSEEMMQLKYPSENRPTLIYTNESGAINVAINLTPNKAHQDAIAPYTENFVQTFKKLYPSAEWIGDGVKKINGKKVGYIEFVTPAVDTKIYNLMFFTDLDEKLLLCTFNCTEESIEEWSPTAHEIMSSLKVKK